MKIAVVYIYPMIRTGTYFPLAKRFADTWKQFPPAIPYELHVVCNGGKPGSWDMQPFDGIETIFHPNDNIGWDIGAYQWAAEAIKCDVLVCFGSPVHFYRSGWLERIAESYVMDSPGLFGCWGVPYAMGWHIRTTAFWLDPNLMQAYPYIIGSSRASRYSFESGPNSITSFSEKAGFTPYMITFDGTHGKDGWMDVHGGRGNCLVFDRFTYADRPPTDMQKV